MRNPQAHIREQFGGDESKHIATRDGFGTGAIEAGRVDERVVVLSADLKESTRAEVFEKEFPERFIEMGVAEQNMATVAAGMAAAGKIPFITSYAAFSPGRNYEQIRTTIALNDMPVIVCGMHAGVSVGPDGATHQMLEDVGMMRMLPNMTVIVPGDAEEARKATLAAAKLGSPAYMRFGRSTTPVFTTRETPFEIGKALVLWESPSPKVAVFSTGSLSATALSVAEKLSVEGVETIVVHVPTVKPLDAETLRSAAKRAGKVVTIEEHQIAGGFGSAIAEFISEECPMIVRRLGIKDAFGQSGTPDELMAHYGINEEAIAKAIRDLVIY